MFFGYNGDDRLLLGRRQLSFLKSIGVRSLQDWADEIYVVLIKFIGESVCTRTFVVFKIFNRLLNFLFSYRSVNELS